MYVDFGRWRGRLRFSRKDVLAVIGLLASCGGYVLHTELALADLRRELAVCKAEVKQMQQQAGVNYATRMQRSNGQ